MIIILINTYICVFKYVDKFCKNGWIERKIQQKIILEVIFNEF